MKNHRHIKDNLYEKIPQKMLAWEGGEGITPEIQFLIDYKGGGMANLFGDLPHLIGSISNLSSPCQG